ncbi:RRP9 / ribosomal RNA-processing protein 9 [Leishmania donovani]|uniref:WD_domain_G-beta_repeat_putative/Pfam:PF00400 n=1 Tax=Leishmania donovani TaxID=5661 RepID=A0A6J8FLB7_LEIDO|nr:RRP9 / ribosomal RNA-processing protein 9 [Leishmania donovani]VDZ48199.1 WD_domain_G-beta_repeat_putative/Pfam:PF00400 [Leishmania donovani]
MLSKKKAAKRAAISATVRREHQAHEKLSQQNTQLHTSRKKAAEASTSSRGADDFVDPKKSRTVLNSADAAEAVGSGNGNRAAMIRSLGDHINTRLQEVTFEDDLDGDVFHERRAQLMEEARLAAGVKQRDMSTSVRHYLGHQAETHDLHSVRIAHNCNSITCVAALGTDRIVYGDKSGKVYLVDISLATSGAGMSVSDKAELQRRRKVLLEPVLPSGIVSIAVSDTTANRPTARDVFEKTTVDMSCPSYVAAGAIDGSISVWETLTKAHKGLLCMHRKPITGLQFRMDTATLYSSCEDGTLRVWAVPQMIAVDKLFGHEGPTHFLDCLRKETAATVGEDGTMRFWKMDAATQQAYNYAPARLPEKSFTPAAAAASPPPPPPSVVMDTVAMLNESIIVAGARDGAVVVFDVNRCKPLVVVPAAHGYGFIGDGTGLEKAAAQLAEEDDGDRVAREHATAPSFGTVDAQRRNPNPITTVAAVPYADVVATGSYDGVVRVWHVVGVGAGATAPGKRTDDGRNGDAAPSSRKGTEPQLVLVAELPVRAIVNSLRFCSNGDVLLIAAAKEPRRGRWVVQSSARNGVLLVPLTDSGRKKLQGVRGEVEHIPAQLFGIDDAAAEEDAAGEEEEEAHVSEADASKADLDASGELHASDGEDGAGRDEAEDVADMFDVGPDGMMRFREGVSLAGEAAVTSKKRKKGKSGMPKVLRQSKKLSDVTVARDSGSHKMKKALSAKKAKRVEAKSEKLHASNAALATTKKAMKRAKA